jgi:hypothetical protein
VGARLACRVLGHDHDFRADGPVVRWSCARCGAPGGEKRYGSEAEAARFAAAFDRRPRGPAAVLAALGGRVDRERRRGR